MRKQLSLASALTLVLVVAIAGTARADTTLGSTVQPSGSSAHPCEGAVIAQIASASATPYTVPSPGTITAWQLNTINATPGATATLVVLRSTDGFDYTVVGADSHSLPNPLPGVASFTVSSPIAVNGGEILALYDSDTNYTCYFQAGSTPITDALIALESPSTPSAGQSLTTDDYSGAGYTLNLAATLTPPSTPAQPKKKCKKKKKRSAQSAKKKCKKKKKR
jgi:hypothetical protein